MSVNMQDISFDIPDSILDEIQNNIQNIINNFDVPEENKLEVIKQINYIYTRTKYLSMTDELTGLLNRRSFESNFEKEYLRTERYENNLTLAMIDVDLFKKINDTYGHQCGDFVLKQIANAALQTFRKTDSIFRYGGEEFAVILTETDIEKSIIPIERFRKTVETLDLTYQNQKIHVTVSIGACQYNNKIKSKEEFLELTDKALYEAKNTGRNKYVLNNHH